jgi:predicted TIM-barrel fold metal-dependent hydrolase
MLGAGANRPGSVGFIASKDFRMSSIMTLLRAAAAALVAVASAGCASIAPSVDHHQHVFSRQLAALLSSAERPFPELTARDIVAELDKAGIRRAVLLSAAYLYAAPSRAGADTPAKVRAENDWTGGQAVQYPDRLVAFCGLNPLTEDALAELERCAREPALRRGIKLHLGNSDVQLGDPVHVATLQRVFAAANARRMAIVVHVRASISRKRPYGAAEARIFLDRIMPAAPDVAVQIAHFAGTGPGYDDPPAQAAMAEFAAAVARGEPTTRRLWFDVASIVDAEIAPETAAMLVGFIRQVGPGRVLYGSDAAVGTNLRPRESWAAFRRLPLSDEELATIARNVAPYLQ